MPEPNQTVLPDYQYQPPHAAQVVHLFSFQAPTDAAYLAGHFPDYPLVPGCAVLGWMVEAVKMLPATVSPGKHIRRVTNFKCIREIIPGTHLKLGIEIKSDKFICQIHADDQLMASAILNP